jgi:hypothetical protein
MILMKPLYNGWIRRHRGKDETRRPAPWRATPPVSDELWARVEEVRRTKTRGGGPKNWDRVDLLGGLLVPDAPEGAPRGTGRDHGANSTGRPLSPRRRVAAHPWRVPEGG